MLERQAGIGESAKTIYLMTHQRGQREALKHARERPPVDQAKPSRAVKNMPGCHVFSERLAASHKILSTEILIMKEKAR